jgi:tetratricopeptide (TPR) repeat protein
MLVLLDNGQSPEQIRPMLPGGGGNVVLVTSRDQLSGLIAREGATRMPMDVLSAAEARQLLEGILGAPWIEAHSAAVAELAQLCAYLPLALRIAATALHDQPHQPVDEFTARLRRDPVGELVVQDDPDFAVRAAFDLSYLALPEPARRLFRRLALIPGPDFTAESAAVVAGSDLPDTVRLLDLLVRAHLLEQRVPGRYSCHDLMRLYAGQRAAQEEPEERRAELLAGLYGHYLSRAADAARSLYPNLLRLPGAEPDQDSAFTDATAAMAWLETERPTLVSALSRAAQDGPREVAWRLADLLRGYFMARLLVVEWLTCAETALGAAQADGDLHGQAAARLSLGALHSRRGDQPRAIEELTRAQALAGQAEWSHGETAALGALGTVYLRVGRPADAATSFQAVLACAERSGQVAVHANTLINLGQVSLLLGRLSEAVEQTGQALDAARRIGARSIEAVALTNLGEAHHACGAFDRAVQLFGTAMELHRELGARDGVGSTLCYQAALHRDRGEEELALSLVRQALDLTRGGDLRHHDEQSLIVLGSIHQRLGDAASAADCWARALQLATTSGHRYAEANALIGMGEAELVAEAVQQARQRAVRARSIALAGGYQVLHGRALCLLARVCLHAGQVRQALRAAEQAVTVQCDTGHRWEQARSRLALARALAAAGDRAAARAQWISASEIFAEIGARPGRDLLDEVIGGF